MSDQIRQAIETTAKGPQSVRTDAGEVHAQDITKQIEADKYLSAKAAVQQKNRGLRFNKFLPPGTY
ncbi:MAG: hypothetical protein EBQ89_00520 [Alphaproteobacteria bacterium]|nr:hypothetical protein [Alphaproteobacteria bacterium]